MQIDWFKDKNGTVFSTDWLGFNQFVCFEIHTGATGLKDNDIRVGGFAVERCKARDFTAGCEYITTTKRGIPDVILNTVYAGKEVVEYRKENRAKKEVQLILL